MNVKDLKELLQQCPNEMEVVLADSQEGYEHVRHSLIEFACVNLWETNLQDDPNIEKVYDEGDVTAPEGCTKILVLWP